MEDLTKPPIISIHIPKTAGTTFRQILDAEFGDSLLAVYGASHPSYERLSKVDTTTRVGVIMDGFQILHGHYKPSRFDWSSECKKITWVREPYQRCASQYSHLRRQVANGTVHPFMPNLEMTFEAFIEQPEITNFMSQYMEGTDISNWSCVGVVEEFEPSLEAMAQALDRDLVNLAAPTNENPDKTAKKYTPDSKALQSKFEELNSLDYELYEKALDAIKG